MDSISSVAAMATGMQQANIDAQVAISTMKMANEQQEAVMALLLKTMQMATTGLGQYVDVRA